MPHQCFTPPGGSTIESGRQEVAGRSHHSPLTTHSSVVLLNIRQQETALVEARVVARVQLREYVEEALEEHVAAHNHPGLVLDGGEEKADEDGDDAIVAAVGRGPSADHSDGNRSL